MAFRMIAVATVRTCERMIARSQPGDRPIKQWLDVLPDDECNASMTFAVPMMAPRQRPGGAAREEGTLGRS
jgi:hypothetical protein